MKNSSDQYIQNLRRILEHNCNEENAYFMKKYMRNLFPFFGIKSPERKQIFREFNKSEGLPAISELGEIIKILYDQPEREFHYFAIELSDRFSKKLDENGIELFEFLIVNKSWWDTVDFIAIHSLSQYFKINSGLISPVTGKWMKTGNIWLQRSCILFQLKYLKNIDLKLLYSLISELKDSNEFFIQKAIGWILREYSKINPDEVLRYAGIMDLKPLSRREAQKILIKKGYFAN